jgi:hypothetical protein
MAQLMRERWIVLDNLQELENSFVDLGAGHASPKRLTLASQPCKCLEVDWCGREDSNLHVLSETSTSS